MLLVPGMKYREGPPVVPSARRLEPGIRCVGHDIAERRRRYDPREGGLEVVIALSARYGVGECELWSTKKVAMGKQRMRQAARLAASQVQARRRSERAEHDRRLKNLAVEVLTARSERDATIAAPNNPPVPPCSGDLESASAVPSHRTRLPRLSRFS